MNFHTHITKRTFFIKILSFSHPFGNSSYKKIQSFEKKVIFASILLHCLS